MAATRSSGGFKASKAAFARRRRYAGHEEFLLLTLAFASSSPGATGDLKTVPGPDGPPLILQPLKSMHFLM